MQKVDTIAEIRYYVECPHCAKTKSRIDHLFSRLGDVTSWGPWYCDECGGAYAGEVRGSDVFVEPILDKRKDKCLVVLRNSNVLLVVEGMYFDGELDIDHQRYFYEEHTCPTNYLGVEAVIDLDNGDEDPHGIFEFVKVIPYTNIEEVDSILEMIYNDENLS